MTSYTKRCTRPRHVSWCKFGWNPTTSFWVIYNLVSLSWIPRQAVYLDFACLSIHRLTTGPELFACLSIYENAETCPLVWEFRYWDKIHVVVALAVSLAISVGSDLWQVVLCSHLFLTRIFDGLLQVFWKCRLEYPESKHISGYVFFFRTVDHGRATGVYYPTHSLNIPAQTNAWNTCARQYLKGDWFQYEIHTVFPGVRSISRDKIVTDRVRVSKCHGTTQRQ